MWIEIAYEYLTIKYFTSTPHQPANACFEPSLLPNVAESSQVQSRKTGKIKGLPPKPLFLLSY